MESFLEKLRAAERSMHDRLHLLESQKSELEGRENELIAKIQALELDLSRARDQCDDATHLEDVAKIRKVRNSSKLGSFVQKSDATSPQLQDVIQTLEAERDRAVRDAVDAQTSYEMKSAKMKELREQLYLIEREHKVAKNFVQNISAKVDEIQYASHDAISMGNRVLEQCRRIESLVQQHVGIEKAMVSTQNDMMQRFKSINERVANLDLEVQLKDARVKSQVAQIEGLEIKIREYEAASSQFDSRFNGVQNQLQRALAEWGRDKEDLDALRIAVDKTTSSLQQSSALASSQMEKVNQLSNQLHQERLEHQEELSKKSVEVEILRVQVEEFMRERQTEREALANLKDQLEEAVSRESMMRTESVTLRQQMHANRSQYEQELSRHQTDLMDMTRRKDEEERNLQLKIREVEELKTALRAEKSKAIERATMAKTAASDPEVSTPSKPKIKSKKAATTKEIRFSPTSSAVIDVTHTGSKKTETTKKQSATPKYDDRKLMRPFKLNFDLDSK